MKQAATTTAATTPDGITQQLNHLIAEHKKDYSRQDALQQFIALGMAHKRYDMVEDYLASFIAMGAKVPPLYHLIATVQEKKQDYVKAVASIKQLFAAEGIKTEAMYEAAARILHRSEAPGDLKWCHALLEEAHREYPHNVDIMLYLAETCQMLDKRREVSILYDAAIKRDPFNDTLYFVKGLHDMSVSNLTDGFEVYKHRFAMPDFKKDTPFFPWDSWQGEPLKGKKIYLWSEQGVGDMVMWLGLLPWVIGQEAVITCAVPKKLLALLRRSFPSVEVVEKAQVLPQETLMADFDYHCPLGNLMQYVLPHYKPAGHAPYLVADAQAVASKRQEYLAVKPGAQKLVGLSWYSTAVTGWRRNIPLETLRPLMQEPDTVYVSLQYNQQLDDVSRFNESGSQYIIADLSFIPVDDMDCWATQHAAMDEIISIQNSSAHLAGGLGVPTSLLLPTYGSFHWGNATAANVWYDSVTIYQQTVGQPWHDLIHDIAARRMGG